MSRPFCKYVRRDGSLCERLVADKSEMCICHLDDDSKDQMQFCRQFDKIISDEESSLYDFEGFVFPSTFDLNQISTTLVQTNKCANFRAAKFYSPLSLHSILISEGVDETRFTDLSELNFDRARFMQGATFSDVIFKRDFSMKLSYVDSTLEFIRCKFNAKADLSWLNCPWSMRFIDTVFEKELELTFCKVYRAIFDACGISDHQMFRIPTDFSKVEFDARSESGLTFRHVNLQLVRFLEAPIKKMEFVGVRWGSPKTELADEVFVNSVIDNFSKSLKKDNSPDSESKKLGLISKDDISFAWIECAQVYRKLQLKYLEYIDPYQAGVFHRKEMDLIKKALHEEQKCTWRNLQLFKWVKNLGLRAFYTAYDMLSRYGESIGRSFTWIIVALFLFPYLITMHGITIVPFQSVNYELFSHWCTSDYFWHDYWYAFKENLKFLFWQENILKEENERVNFILMVQTLVMPILIALHLLTIRRRFKRKSY